MIGEEIKFSELPDKTPQIGLEIEVKSEKEHIKLWVLLVVSMTSPSPGLFMLLCAHFP